MSGRLRDAWDYAWQDIWLRFEQCDAWSQLAEDSGYTREELYMDLYVELAKALKKAPQPTIYTAAANDPVLARAALQDARAETLRSESATAHFFESAAQTISESGSRPLELEFARLVQLFLRSRNLRYELLEPFELRSHLPGVFEALVADVTEEINTHPQLSEAFRDFSHAFRSLQRTHVESDMKTCIHKSAMLVEALASVCPGARGNNFGALCNSIQCWPNSLVRESVKKLYEFSSDFPGVRHNIVRGRPPRALEMRDSMIVPLLLLTAAGYFGGNAQLLDTLRSELTDPPQLPPDPPTITQPAEQVAIP
jgi:hypothetical protein